MILSFCQKMPEAVRRIFLPDRDGNNDLQEIFIEIRQFSKQSGFYNQRHRKFISQLGIFSQAIVADEKDCDSEPAGEKKIKERI
ncbi:MAG: hypothetical protein R2941_23635 [Desulfobacterales bacterium]